MRPQSSRVLRHCQICGKEFTTYQILIDRGNGKFCSSQCNRAAQPRKLASRRLPIPHPTDPTAMLVPLTRGMFATIDAIDVDLVTPHLWVASPHRNRWRVQTRIVDGEAKRTLFMHQLILGTDDVELIDHRDGDGLNNRRSNLREANHTTNQQNQRRRSDCRSGFKGVHTHSSGLWAVRIKVNGTVIHLGYFGDAEDAARVYDDAARRYFGVFARINFPREGEQQA